MAKKIMALVMAIALVVCFAVSASAEINVATTTSYVTGTSDIKVNVRVTGVAEGANVTYYATNGSTDVHIDQAKATATGATFEFNTAATNLDSAVKVGYTGATVAEDADITGYTVTYPDSSKVIPTEALTVDFPYTLEDGKVFSAVNVTAGTAVVANAVYSAGTVTVTFTSISSDVTLAVATTDAPEEVPTATAEFIESAAIVSTGKVDGVIVGNQTVVDEDVNAAEGNRKLTVIGKVNAESEYGIIVSETALTTDVISAAEFATLTSYAGATKDAETGVFAIQLIDTSAENSEDAFVKKGVAYYTAVYAKDANGSYVITANANAVTAN